MQMTHSMFNQLRRMLLYTTSNLVIAVQTCYSHYVRHDNFLYWSHIPKKKKNILGAHFFFLLSVFNTFQGTLKAFSTTPQGHRSLLNLIQGALLQLLNCTIVALDWSQSIENRIGNHVGSKHGQNVERYLASFCNTGVSYDREIQQNIHSTWGEYARVHHQELVWLLSS